MKLVLIAFVFFACITNAQVVRIHANYGGSGINSFIGQRSIFLNDSSFSITNGWSAGLSLKLKTFSFGRIFMGTEYQHLQRLVYTRIRVADGFVSNLNTNRFSIAGLPISFFTGKDGSRWSFSFSAIPSVLLSNSYITCLTCEESEKKFKTVEKNVAFLIPLQIQALRKFRTRHFSFEVGPFLKYHLRSVSTQYSLNPFFGGVQIQAGWEK